MGIQLYIKSLANRNQSAPIFIYAQHKGKIFKKNIGISVLPKEWNKNTYQIKSSSISTVAINKKLLEITNTLREAWSLFESDMYTWDELCNRLKGGKPDEGVMSFIEDVLGPGMRLSTFQSYKYSYRALLKALGRDSLTFKELNYDNLDQAVRVWKNEEKSPSSIETYLKHLGVIINEANDREFVNYRFEKKKKWRVKKQTKVIESATTEQLLNSVKNINDIYDFQAFSFWLLMFCMRGLYPSDIVKMYNNELINESESNLNRYVEHKRSKTGEPMKILYSCSPTEEIINALQISIAITHLNRSNKFPDVYPKGWHTLIFFEYPEELHKNVWDVYIKRCRKVVGLPFKTARKTFESYALMLDIPAEVRYRLLGHQDRTIKRFYQNWEWDKMIDKVDEAHLKVLEEFKVKEIWYQLRKRAKEIGLNDGIVNKSLLTG
jgi:hypothetical protein